MMIPTVHINASIDSDDAREWGRVAFDMGLTLAGAREQIAKYGCPDRLLPLVDDAYHHARSCALHREA